MKAHPSGPYAVAARKRKEREDDEAEQETRSDPDLDLTDEAKDAAAASALAEAERQFQRAKTLYPGRTLSVNVFGASTGSEQYSIEEEGMNSTLTECGYDTPAIVAPATTPRGFRALTAPERRNLGPTAVTIYNAGRSKLTSKHVEWQVQLAFERKSGIKVLWRRTGWGGPKGRPERLQGGHPLHSTPS